MKKKRFLIVSTLFIILYNFLSFADVRLPSIISSGMVLQQKSIVNIWGWAAPGEKVTIQAGWAAKPVTVITGNDGKWIVKIKTTKANGPYTIKIKGNNEIILNDILLGELWLCSGQSNMEFTIKMLGGWKQYENEKNDLEKNDYSKIRICLIERAVSNMPLDTCTANWIKTNTTNAENFSATAFFFGMELYKRLKVPVGLVTSSWSGTPAQAWTQKEYLVNDLKFYFDQPAIYPAYPSTPSALFNAMINPIKNFTIKGAIWYQGESNRADADLYNKLFSTMIQNWRDVWKQGDFPFYFVQIAPYTYGDFPGSSAFLREAQFKTLALKNTGMAVTMDIGNLRDIHPKNKPEVGRRLALWAFANTYKIKMPSCSGPIYKNMVKEGNKIRLFFDHADGGLMSNGGELAFFTIAGKDLNFVPAKAEIDKNSLLVFNEKIEEPEAVRYAFGEPDTATLFNKHGLSASSFRTDDEPALYRSVKYELFKDEKGNIIQTGLNCADKACKIHYTIDGTIPSISSGVYSAEISLNKSVVIKAKAFKGEIAARELLEIKFNRHAGVGKSIIVSNKNQEKVRGEKSLLIDGLNGSLRFDDGNWMGLEGFDLDAVIDLGDTISLKNINADFIQNNNSWIFLPEYVEYSISKDGSEYKNVNKTSNDEPLKKEGAFIKTFSAGFPKEKFRYIKIKAKNIEKCPEWHRGAGGKAWIFIDEIVIE